MSLNMKITNEFTQQKIWISRCDVHEREHAPKAPCAFGAQYAECIRHFQYTLRVYSRANERNEIQQECMNLDQ